MLILRKVFSRIPYLPRLVEFARSPAGALARKLLMDNRYWVLGLFALSNIAAIAVSSRVVIFISFLQHLSGKSTNLVLPLPAFSLKIPFIGEQSDRASQLVALLLMSVVLSIISLSLEYTTRRMTARLSMRFTRSVRRMAITHAFKLDTAYYSRNKLGEVGVQLFTPIGAITSVLISTQQVMNSLLQILGVAAIIVYLSSALTVWMVVVGILMLFYMAKFQSVLGQASHHLRELDKTAGGISNELLYGMRVIKQSGQEIRQRNRFLRTYRASDRQRIKVIDIQATGNLLVQIGGMTAILVVAGAVSVMHNINLIQDMGFTLGYFMALWRLFNELYSLTAILNELTPQLPYLSSLAATLNDEKNVEQVTFGSGTQRTPAGPMDIHIRDLNFAYIPERRTLKSINADMREGTITGLVGLSGSGKTTLLEILARLRVPQEGRIEIGGRAAADYDLSSLRRMIGYVNQETIIFNESARYNIGFGRPNASLEEIRAAARIAEADSFIWALPAGYDELLGERGQQISGGQRQRIALARVFLQQPKLLLLDEATSALDIQTERNILENLRFMQDRRTIVVATHRLVTITNFDQIIFIHDGEIIETGNHAELMGRRGMYYDLFRFQTEAMNAGLSPDLEFATPNQPSQ